MFRESIVVQKPHQQGLASGVESELEAAIRRSQLFLLGEQKPEGYWIGELMVDATLVADTLAYHHWNGKINAGWQRKAVNHIFSRQLADGGWNIYYGGPAEVNATIKCYLALKLAGVSVTDRRMLRARELALSLGGVPRMNTFSKLYLALLGLFPWEYVPTIPCEVILIGKWFYVNFNEMSSWSRSMRRVRRPRSDLRRHAQFAHRAQSAGVCGWSSASASRGARIKEAGARDRAQCLDRTLFFAGVGHRDCEHLSARIGPARRSSG